MTQVGIGVLSNENQWTARQVFGGGTPTSDDTAIIVARAASNPMASGGAHAVRDESTYAPASDGGYASFDARAEYTAAINSGHLHGFQNRLLHSGAGVLGQMVGFTSQATINGPVTDNFGMRVSDPLGTGVVTNNYGLRIDTMSRGTNNYGVYVASNQNYFGGGLQVGGTFTVVGGSVTLTGFSTTGGILTTSSAGVLQQNASFTIVNGVLAFGTATANIRFGAASTSVPMLKRSTTLLQCRLGDDSDYATLQGKLRVHANAVAETPTATHTLRVFDAGGTEYKVLAVAA